MAAPTVYKWTDASAPTLFRNDSTSVQAVFQACLIDGYGAKTAPVLGVNKWSIPFSDATSFILQQGGSQTRKCGLKFYNPTTTGQMYYVAALSWTDLNTPVGIWTANSTLDRFATGYSNNATYQIPWIIIATERAVYAQFGYNATGIVPSKYDSVGGVAMNNGHWFFGDYKPEDAAQTVNQMIAAPNVNSTTYTNSSINFTSSTSTSGAGLKRIAGNFANIDIPGGLIVNTMNLRDSSSGVLQLGEESTSVYRPSFPSPLNGALYLDVLRIITDRVIMGEFPGLLYPLNVEIYPANGTIPEIDGTGTYTGEKMLVFTAQTRGKYLIRDGEWGVD